jgi:ABC-type amino acid transport substrate-binding protein
MIVVLIVGFAIGLVAAPLLMPQSTAADPVWDSVVASGKIRIGTDPSWPPYESLDSNNKIVGFEIDLANAIATKLGLTLETSSVIFDNIVSSVKDKSLDMGVSGFSITPDRLEQVAFTIPHSTTQAEIIMTQSKKDALGITMLNSLSDLKTQGLTVGTQTGTTEESELIDAGVSHKSFTDYGTAIQDMMSANPSVDCVYAETPITTSWIAQYQAQGKAISIIYQAPYYPCAFVVNKDARTFLAKVDGALAEIIKSGQMDTLKAKWSA